MDPLKSGPSPTTDALARTFGHEAARAVATLARIFGDLQVAEDAVQDAYVIALSHFERNPLPPNLSAWIFTTAKRALIDRLRREQSGRAKLAALAQSNIASPQELEEPVIADDRLNLIFACCHPSLAEQAQVALILRALCGLSTAQIASALIEPEPTVAQRLVRAKRKIAQARIPFVIPSAAQLPLRLSVVLGVVYAIFNAGYAASSGTDLVRTDLCEEAMYLAHTLSALMPDEPEALALNALLLLVHARRDARVSAAGELVPLERQDRAQWKCDEIAAAFMLYDRAQRHGVTGQFVLEASIAAEHVRADSFDRIDWKAIAASYDRLRSVSPSFAVEVNAAVAHGFAFGPHLALLRLDPLARTQEAARYHYVHAARAWALELLDRFEEAARAYRRALELCGNDSERAFLQRKLFELKATPASRPVRSLL